MSEFPQWPAIRHGPKGEAKVFNSAAEVPAGWTETQNPDYPKPMDGERGPLPASVRNQQVAKPEHPKVETETAEDALIEGNAPEVIARIEAGADLDALEAAEKDREVPRKGVLAAIDKARKAR